MPQVSDTGKRPTKKKAEWVLVPEERQAGHLLPTLQERFPHLQRRPVCVSRGFLANTSDLLFGKML